MPPCSAQQHSWQAALYECNTCILYTTYFCYPSVIERERSPNQCPPFPPSSLQRACRSALQLLEDDCASLQANQEDSISFAAFAVIDTLFKKTAGSLPPQTTAVLKDFLKMQYKDNKVVMDAIKDLDLEAAFTSNFMVGHR